MANVLIVNDEPDLIELCSMILEDHGHRTSSALDESHAVDLAKSCSPEVLLLDLVVPGTSGEHVLESIEREAGRPSVVVMSASVDGEERARAMGADTFLAKPFTEQGLVSAIDRALSRSGSAH